MSIYWNSVLIPTQADFTPSPGQVARFLTCCEALGAFAGAPRRTLFDFDHPRGWLPATDAQGGATLSTMALPSRKVVRSTREFEALATGLHHWAAECSADGPGPRPPFATMVLDDGKGWRPTTEYSLAVRCETHGQRVSMSDLHEEARDVRTAVFFGDPCGPEQSLGLYSDPHDDRRVFEVPGAGSAAFHIEFGTGRLVFPPLDVSPVKLVLPQYSEAARAAFGIGFLEGCQWG